MDADNKQDVETNSQTNTDGEVEDKSNGDAVNADSQEKDSSSDTMHNIQVYSMLNVICFIFIANTSRFINPGILDIFALYITNLFTFF